MTILINYIDYTMAIVWIEIMSKSEMVYFRTILFLN